MAKGTIGAKLVLEGEAAYKTALKQIKQAQSELRSEMKLCQTEFKNSQNTITALQSKYTTLSKQVETAQKKYDVYSEALEKAQKYQKNAAESIETYTKKLDEEKKKLQALESASGTTNEELEEQRKIVKETADSLDDANSKYEQATKKVSEYQTSLNYADAELKDFQQQQAKTKDYLDEAENSASKTAKSIDEYGNEVVEASDETNVFGDVLKANLTSEAILNGIKALVSGIKEIATACIESGMEFESSMSNVKALSGVTQEEFDQLSSKAQEMGASTMFSASQAADAFSYMALAGWDAESMLEGIEPVLNLAAAANMDLATASDIVTDYLTAFGLSAEDAGKFADQMAYAMSNSNTTVELLGESYKNCAAAATSMGFSVEDVTGALMTMANAGVKGGEAGTTLRAVMTRLATNTKDCQDALEGYGVKIVDENGNLKSLSEIINLCASAFEGLNDTETANLAKIIAGQNQYSGFMTILQGVSDAAKESGMSLNDYSEALESCDGAAKSMADTMQDNLKGKITILQSALEGLEIAAYDVFDDGLKDGVDGAADAVSRLTKSVKDGDLHTSLQKISTSLDNLIDKIVDWTEDNLPKIIDGLANIIDNADKILPLIEGIVNGLIAFKTASTAITLVNAAMAAYKTVTESATVAQLAMNVAADANPYVLLASVLIGVATALGGLVVATNDSTSGMTELTKETNELLKDSQSLSDTLNSSAQARAENNAEMEKEADTAHALVAKLETLQQAYAQGADNMDQMKLVVDQLNSIMPDLNLTIDEQTGKLNMSTSALEKNTDALLEQVRAQRYQEEAVEIANEILDAEENLAELSKQRTEAIIEEKEAQEEYNQALNDENGILDTNGGNIDEAIEKRDQAKESLAALNEEIRNEEIELGNLNGEYEEVNDKISENGEALDEAATQYDEYGNAIETTTEEVANSQQILEEAYAEAYTNAQESIEGQVGLFDELKTQSDLTVSQMSANLESQATVFNQYAEDLQTASRLANSGSSPEFQELLSNIESMGVDGAGYLHELVTAAEDNSEEFNELMGAWADMEDAKDRMATSMADFETGFNEGTENLLGDQEEFEETFNESTTSMLDDTQTAVDEAGTNLQTSVNTTLDAVKQAVVTKDPEVSTAAGTLATNANTAVSSVMTYEAWHEFGANAVQGLIDGLDSKLDELKSKAAEVAEAANTAVSGGLQEKSPSRLWRKYGQYAVEGLELGFKDEISSAQNTVYNMVDGFNSIVDYSQQSNDKLGSQPNAYTYANLYGSSKDTTGLLEKIQDVLDEYLPNIGTGGVYLDKTTLVGQIAPDIDKTLGQRSTVSTRGM